jgi:hypothetical protein
MDSLMQENKKDSGASALFLGIMIVGLLAAGGLIAYFALSPTLPPQEARLANGLREGEEFEFLKQRIVLAENRDFTTQSQNLASGIQMNLVGVARNFTGKTITGLEVVGSVVNEKGEVLKQKTAIIIPGPQAEKLEHNKSTPFTIRIDGFDAKDDRANFNFKLNAVRVE